MGLKTKDYLARRLKFKRGVYASAINAALTSFDHKRLMWLEEQLKMQRLGWYYDPTDDKAHIITMTEYSVQRATMRAPWMIDINIGRLDAHFCIGGKIDENWL